ncbi:hypothetical protein Pelo_7001 [Pelomyxa schiedti]|nr:hypothetical protein Pelo_7001 [Pelomyxa schiedti]
MAEYLLAHPLREVSAQALKDITETEEFWGKYEEAVAKVASIRTTLQPFLQNSSQTVTGGVTTPKPQASHLAAGDDPNSPAVAIYEVSAYVRTRAMSTSDHAGEMSFVRAVWRRPGVNDDFWDDLDDLEVACLAEEESFRADGTFLFAEEQPQSITPTSNEQQGSVSQESGVQLVPAEKPSPFGVFPSPSLYHIQDWVSRHCVDEAPDCTVFVADFLGHFTCCLLVPRSILRPDGWSRAVESENSGPMCAWVLVIVNTLESWNGTTQELSTYWRGL